MIFIFFLLSKIQDDIRSICHTVNPVRLLLLVVEPILELIPGFKYEQRSCNKK